MSIIFRVSLVFLFSGHLQSLAQSATNSATSKSMITPDSAYFAEIGDGSFLYTGEEYLPHRLGIKGSPFFSGDQMELSEVHYNGIRYTKIPLLYDLVRQKIVLNRYNENARMSLLNEKIKYFSIAGHYFINTALFVNGEILPESFFEVVHSGKIKIRAARIKRVEITMNTEIPPTFIKRDIFYLRNGDQYYEVNDKKSLINSLSDKKEKVKEFVRKNKFRFKNNLETDLLETAKFYESLTN